MKRILYSGGTIVTGDQVADAILEFASELARQETSDTLQVPIVTEAGLAGHTQLLLGPASQFVVEEFETSLDEPADGDIIDSIREKTAHLQMPKPVPSQSTSDYPVLDDPTQVPNPPLADS